MAAKAPKGVRRSAYYAVADGKMVLQRRSCPRCGTGVLLAEHKDRSSCGKCGYTEFKKR